MIKPVQTDYGPVVTDIVGTGLEARIRLTIGTITFDLRGSQSQWIAQVLLARCRQLLGHELEDCKFCGQKLTGKELP